MVRVLGPARLTGPIFDKELRVSSRRRRNYVLRFVYVGLFTFLLAMIWQGTVSQGTSALYQSARMAEAGMAIMTLVVWFQFIAAQAIAIVMLSTSISDEIYRRTLGLLMTTPIGGFQIVLGKLLSKLLQLVLLLGITLPLLAIVRVFGGVPWGYLVASLCVTFSTVLFVGSLSLLLSIFTRRAYVVIIATILALLLLFALLPLIAAFVVHKVVSNSSPNTFFGALSYVNPYVIMVAETVGLLSARMPFRIGWPIHCGIMLGASALLLLVAVLLVRRAALRQATGQTGLWSGRDASESFEHAAKGRGVRRVVGPPLLWKERRAPLLGRRKAVAVTGIAVALALLFLTYVLCASEDLLHDDETHAAYIVIFVGLGILFTVVMPATCITSEKESRTWPLLLTTAVSDWEIICGKFLGVLRRCLPIWLLLFGHLVLFTVVGVIHPVALAQMGILVAWIVIFLTSTGLYFSTRFRHTTAAVIANMGLAAGLWAVLPILLAITLLMIRGDEDLLSLYMDTNPFVHAAVIASATARHGGFDAYDWMQGGMRGVVDATGWIVLNFIIYVTVGLVFVARAGSRLRLNPF
jgi:ABC-type transport system involved in multi-copper enzyme maturation permease subunit